MDIPNKARCVLLQVVNPHHHHQDSELPAKNLKELEQLVETLGGDVIEVATQHRVQPHPSTYIGGGKVEWLKELVQEKEIDIVVLNNVAKSGQIFRLEQMLWEINPKIQVWDRVDLILNIFDLHANTIEAKLQIELARIQHIGPRIYGLGATVLSKQGAGQGSKGTGETNAEFERRKIKKQTQEIKKKLADLSKDKLQRIQQRKKLGAKTVALVGYTSAGKTTLFNALTGKEREVNQSLFTTLDSVVGKMKLVDQSQDVLISDTIGFIDDLPPMLIDAFRSTLLESLEAQVILHVIDAGDYFMGSKVEVVEGILHDLNIETVPTLVFNKFDTLTKEQYQEINVYFHDRKRIFVSASQNLNLDELKEMILNEFKK